MIQGGLEKETRRVPLVGEFFRAEAVVHPKPKEESPRLDVYKALILGEPDEEGRVEIGIVAGRKIIKRNKARVDEIAEGRMGNHTLTPEPPPFDLQSIFEEAGLEYNPGRGLELSDMVREPGPGNVEDLRAGLPIRLWMLPG